MLHSGHVEFLRQAAAYGELVVALGSDRTVQRLKGRSTVCPEAERLFMVRAVRYVSDAFVSAGAGTLDFEADFRRIRPDVLVVNHDGDHAVKRHLCAETGAQYVVLNRAPADGLTARSSTAQRDHITVPYRVEIAGGWLDQPWVSSHCPGPVICAAIRPRPDFYRRSGLATSTRDRAVRIWGLSIPPGNAEERARVLFCYDNPPGTAQVSGSQDAIGLVMPGLKRMDYAGEYWPAHVETIVDRDVLDWLQQHLYLLPLGPRPEGLDVLAGSAVCKAAVQDLARETANVWQAITDKDAEALGRHLTETFRAQVAMFPGMVNRQVTEGIDSLGRADGYAVSGAGGGGYLVVITDSPAAEMLEIEIV